MSATETKPAHLLKATEYQFEYRQKSNPRTSNLELLTYGTYRIMPGVTSDELYHRNEEALLFCITGAAKVVVENQEYRMMHYDVLYLPLRTAYRIVNQGDQEALLIVFRAPAENVHEVIYAAWRDYSQREDRIRHLKGKDVYVMFDVTEKADKTICPRAQSQ